jgi:hypothetical protein
VDVASRRYMMTLPRAIVTYHKQASEQKDPFGSGCKLHHPLFTDLAEIRLYKIAIQVLNAFLSTYNSLQQYVLLGLSRLLADDETVA